MPALWFSYSIGALANLDVPEPRNSPYTITWHVGRFLRSKAVALGYEFNYRNLDSTQVDAIGPDDIVIGHTWYPDGWMNRALDSAARLKFILQPYSAGMVAPSEVGWIKALFAKANHLFLITGPAWWSCMETSGYGEWKNKATRLDMAVNADIHPYSKTRWNMPGKRAMLAIGNDTPAKGIDLVANLARMSGTRLVYYGNAVSARFQHVPQVRTCTGDEFTPEVIGHLCRECDFFVAMGRADANPTTLLETSAWGLIAACTRESGYSPNEPFLELRLDDMAFNMAQLEKLQQASDYDLAKRSVTLRQHVADHHRWDSFCRTLWAEVEKWL